MWCYVLCDVDNLCDDSLNDLPIKGIICFHFDSVEMVDSLCTCWHLFLVIVCHGCLILVHVACVCGLVRLGSYWVVCYFYLVDITWTCYGSHYQYFVYQTLRVLFWIVF